MPEAWKGYLKFAFCRHPIDRMLSAYRMFTEVRRDVPEHRPSRLWQLLGQDREVTVYRNHKPLFPGLSMGEFLAMARDETIALDDRTPGMMKRKSTLRTHAIPQTHPHNMIGLADYVGRFETLTESMGEIGRRLGVELVLPHTNRTRSDSDWRQHLTPEAYDDAVDYYRADFEQLGYSIEPLGRR